MMHLHEILRQIPAVHEMLAQPQMRNLIEKYSRSLVLQAIDHIQDDFRQHAKSALSADNIHVLTMDEWVSEVETLLESKSKEGLRQVVNATGVILHTNMGRAPLSAVIADAVSGIACCYNNLELDLMTGERGTRYSHIEDRLCRLTGAESALVVNNNAAAVLLALTALGSGQEAIVSRGQLVEIGGSFRVPDVMAQSGVKLVEVGTTNKTHPDDYRKAITSDTAMLVRVHTSNFRMIGFTSDVSLGDMVSIAHEAGIVVLDDLGSGSLIDLSLWGIQHEPTVQESIATGADVVTFSGDKLLGGPQMGLIVGRKAPIDQMKKHPLLRALRVDKMTLAALDAVLRVYEKGDDLTASLPVLRMLSMSSDETYQKAKNLAAMISEVWDLQGEIGLVEGESRAGGGSLPESPLNGWMVAVRPANMSLNELQAKLRNGDTPIMTRIEHESLLLDPRTLLDGDDLLIMHVFEHLAYEQNDRMVKVEVLP